MIELFRRMWIGWNVLVRGIVTTQSRFLMAVTYVVGLAPVAIAMRLLGRRLIDRAPADPNAASYGCKREDGPMGMDGAARMF